jgi:HEPN domain-containing protein
MRQLNSQKAKEWFKIGDNEFGFAELGYRDEENEFYSEICFMLQQAIEKYLKGYLVYNEIKPEKVHDLGYLCK